MAKVLCLFDQQSAIEQLDAQLSGRHTVEFFTDADAAIRALQDLSYDVLLCSAFIRTPSIVSVLYRLKQLGVLQRTRVLCVRDQVTAVTISCDVLLKRSTTAMGAADYMSLDKLIRTHKTLLPVSID